MKPMTAKNGVMIALLSLASSAVWAAHAFYYTEFLETTAGTYYIVDIMGLALKDFVLLLGGLIAGIAAILYAGLKSAGKFTKIRSSTLFFIWGLSILLLPFVSTYGLSRMTGLVMVQTVAGVAIILNVVVFLVGGLFGLLACLELLNLVLAESRSQPMALGLALAGILTGVLLPILLFHSLVSSLGYAWLYLPLAAVLLVLSLCSDLIKWPQWQSATMQSNT